MQKIKKAVRSMAVVVKAKNTLIRRAIRINTEKHPEWVALLPYVKGNVALVFTGGDDLPSMKKKMLLDLRISAPAKIGTFAPEDVTIKKGGTGLEPTKTSFLQALNIASKINRGQIDILQDVLLIKSGAKIGNSESLLLQMLNIRPFSYGLTCQFVYEDGKVYPAKFLDTTRDMVVNRITSTLSIVAAISLALGIPSVASVPHSILNAYKNLLSITMETGYMFDQAKLIKEQVQNPGAFKAPVNVTPTPGGKKEPEPEPEPEPVKEESGEDMGFNFFEE
jgi:large subunit ribosomal protein LP0